MCKYIQIHTHTHTSHALVHDWVMFHTDSTHRAKLKHLWTTAWMLTRRLPGGFTLCTEEVERLHKNSSPLCWHTQRERERHFSVTSFKASPCWNSDVNKAWSIRVARTLICLLLSRLLLHRRCTEGQKSSSYIRLQTSSLLKQWNQLPNGCLRWLTITPQTPQTLAANDIISASGQRWYLGHCGFTFVQLRQSGSMWRLHYLRVAVSLHFIIILLFLLLLFLLFTLFLLWPERRCWNTFEKVMDGL